MRPNEGLTAGDFAGAERAVLAGCQFGVQFNGAHAQAMQADNLVLEVTKHTLDLMVAAFVQGQQAAVAAFADVAQLAECVLGKDEVTGSSPVIGSDKCKKCLKTNIISN